MNGSVIYLLYARMSFPFPLMCRITNEWYNLLEVLPLSILKEEISILHNSYGSRSDSTFFIPVSKHVSYTIFPAFNLLFTLADETFPGVWGMAVTIKQVFSSLKEQETINQMQRQATAEHKKWWISLKLNSNKNQFLYFYFITFHNLQFFFFFLLSYLQYFLQSEKNDKIIYQNCTIVSIHFVCYLHKNVINWIEMRQEIY